MEVTPRGNMLFVENKDIPGVIGKVGTLLGSLNVNIAAYLLSRSRENDHAFGVIRIDHPLEKKDLKTLSDIDEIQSVKQIRAIVGNKK